ncbi:hypothetical protein BASA81_000784 [Batrachochytrium salamandrivorans]|nr:hypothetical protein BASA81_000784 [Batrachochytrium salamandrivorans]
MSFPQIYFGTLGLAFVGDRLGLWHHSGKSCWDSFPAADSIKNFSLPESSANLVLFALVVLVPTLAVWRWFWKTVVFSKLAEICMGKGAAHGKFTEQAWLALHYAMVTLLGYWVLKDKPWWAPIVTRQAMNAPLQERMKDQQDLGLQALYATQLAFYMLELGTLVLEAKTRKRSDVVVYFFHHIYTVVLMAGSWVTWSHRIGSLVLILHDVGDIFLPIGKCFTYAEQHVKQTCSRRTFQLVQFLGIFFFVLFIVAFAVPRILTFGGLIYFTAYELDWTTCCGEMVNAAGVCVGGVGATACPAPFFIGLLVCVLMLLWPMHVFWMWLIIKMAAKVVFGQYQDVRSDDEGEEEKKKA